MTAPSSLFRPLLIGAVAIAMLSQSGCAWTRSKLGMDAKYQDSVQNQPLEVPPGLDAPADRSARITVPDLGPNAGSGVGRHGRAAAPPPSPASPWPTASTAPGAASASRWARSRACSSSRAGAGAEQLRSDLPGRHDAGARANRSTARPTVVALGQDGQPLAHRSGRPAAGPAQGPPGLSHRLGAGKERAPKGALFRGAWPRRSAFELVELARLAVPLGWRRAAGPCGW